IAFSASPGELISTKPKPRERPVARSVITAADSQDPICANNASRSAEVVSKDRLPTKSFLPMDPLLSSATLEAGGWATQSASARDSPGRLVFAPAQGRRASRSRVLGGTGRGSLGYALMAAPFGDRYGPCALVAGAAAGLGAEWARQIAARGLDLVLIDRDSDLLGATADEIEAVHGVAVRQVALDLARADLLDLLRPHIADR